MKPFVQGRTTIRQPVIAATERCRYCVKQGRCRHFVKNGVTIVATLLA
jgi:hypothetical protein